MMATPSNTGCAGVVELSVMGDSCGDRGADSLRSRPQGKLSVCPSAAAPHKGEVGMGSRMESRGTLHFSPAYEAQYRLEPEPKSGVTIEKDVYRPVLSLLPSRVTTR